MFSVQNIVGGIRTGGYLWSTASCLPSNSDSIISSKSASCMAPICAVGWPFMGMKRKVGMLRIPNIWASSRSWSMSTL